MDPTAQPPSSTPTPAVEPQANTVPVAAPDDQAAQARSGGRGRFGTPNKGKRFSR